MPDSLTSTLYDILGRPLSTADLRRAALHVLDWLGCAAIGAQTATGALFAARQTAFGAGPCGVIGGPRGVSAAAAAFANGALGNILEMDDIHRTSILHPAPVVIPAVLAVAQLDKLDAGAFLDGVVRGYEALIRIGRATGPSHYAYWHNTGSCGPFGAAAGVACALGLDRAAFMSALGNAGSTASGLWQCRHEPVMTKQWHTARAAEDGFVAAMMARDGLTGPAFILEGEQGFFAATAPDATHGAVIAGPDAPWLIYDTSFKPWAACRHAHPTIDAALAARSELEGRLDSISKLTVETYGDAVRFCDRSAPKSEIEAKFSLQHVAAVTLTGGAPDLADFGADRRGDPMIARLRDKVRVVVDEDFDRSYPDHYGAALTATLNDGSQLCFAVTDATGDPARPLGEDAVIAKAQMLLAAAGLQSDAIDALVGATMALAETGDPKPFLECLP